jgi:hypothetical protein
MRPARGLSGLGSSGAAAPECAGGANVREAARATRRTIMRRVTRSGYGRRRFTAAEPTTHVRETPHRPDKELELLAGVRDA